MATVHLFFLRSWRQLWLAAALLTYCLLACYQLGLPGLHYDEAREAGLNAMELLTGAPVTAFRNVTLSVGGLHLPVMVQDYIGALNIYLALPVLWISGIGVPNLRIVAVFTGLVSLLLLERAVTAWAAWMNDDGSKERLPLSLPGLLAVTLLVASPSFVFWSRQGIFVTNLTQPLTFCCLWQGVRWLQLGHKRALLLSAFAGGCALYAKLLAIWMVGPFVLLAGSWWLWQSWRRAAGPALSFPLFSGAFLAFTIPLLPLLFFNWQSGGTWRAISGNMDTSYYGVENWAFMSNLVVRSRQLLQTVQGSHLWYLGALYGNAYAPWIALVSLLWALWRRPELIVGPLLLALAALACTLFTISDLFITHYALIQPFVIGLIALALTAAVRCENDGSLGIQGVRWLVGWFSTEQTNQRAKQLPEIRLNQNDFRLRRRPARQWLLIGLTVLWLGADLAATVRYHAALARSGGLADHSDLSYHLAYHLRYNGLGAPVALDWGFDAPVRYLSQGAVTPIEIFGYGSPTTPDPDFGQRLHLFLDNPNNVYLLHTPTATIFQGRRERFFEAINKAGRHAQVEATFTQRDGTPLVELWRVLPP